MASRVPNRNLFRHPRTLAVKPFNRVKIPGETSSVYVRGLTRPLKDTFYPHFSVHQAKMRRGRGSSSKKIGTRVHREVECWIKGLEQPNKRLHRYTIQIQKSFTALKLEPIASEFPVISVDGAYLTHIDVLCKATRIDGKAELVLVSLKTGYSRGALNYKNNCKAPCQSIPNSQQNHHILQGVRDQGGPRHDHLCGLRQEPRSEGIESSHVG